MLDVITEGGRRGRGDGRALAMMSSSCLLGGESCARIQGFSHGNRARNAANEVVELINTDMMDKKKRIVGIVCKRCTEILVTTRDRKDKGGGCSEGKQCACKESLIITGNPAMMSFPANQKQCAGFSSQNDAVSSSHLT